MDFDIVPYEDVVWGERLGGGSFGSVYKAGQYLGLDIAIKEIHPSTEYNVHKYFEREWRILRECQHPNIVLFLGLCKGPGEEGRAFIVSEYVLRGNLRSFIRFIEPLPWRLRLSFATDIARAVAYLHARQCLHRDLKGENLLITSNNRIKVVNLGFARITSRSADEMKHMTYCGTDIATRILVGAKVYARKAPVFIPDEDIVRARVSHGCPAVFVDLAVECCSFSPADRPALPDILMRLRAIETCLSATEDAHGHGLCPLFGSNEEDVEEAVIEALIRADVQVEGTSVSMLRPSPSWKEGETGYCTARGISYDSLPSDIRSARIELPAQFTATVINNVVPSSLLTIRETTSAGDSIDLAIRVSALAPKAGVTPVKRKNAPSGSVSPPVSHRFSMVRREPGLMETRRVQGILAANLILARAWVFAGVVQNDKNKCLACTKRLGRAAFRCDDCGLSGAPPVLFFGATQLLLVSLLRDRTLAQHATPISSRVQQRSDIVYSSNSVAIYSTPADQRTSISTA